MFAERAEIAPQLRVDDHAAFALVVSTHQDALVNYLSLLCGCRAQAQDLAQETFIRLYVNAARYEEQGRLRPYLFRIATNLARSAHRRAQRRRLLAQALGREPEQEAARDPYAALVGQEQQSRLWRALERLPLHLRAPLLLYEVEGLSYLDIARALDCRVGTVKSRLSRARARLGQLLARAGGDDG